MQMIGILHGCDRELPRTESRLERLSSFVGRLSFQRLTRGGPCLTLPLRVTGSAPGSALRP
jgi:hypothetical protein